MSKSQFEIALVITGDRALAEELTAVFPSHEVSESDNFVGGTEIAMFFVLARPILLKLLEFLEKNRDRLRSAKLTIGTHDVSLEGYSAKELESLMSSVGFQDALRSARENPKP